MFDLMQNQRDSAPPPESSECAGALGGVREIATIAIAPRFGEQWLNQHQIGYANLDQDDRDAIREFALLWQIFEFQSLFGNDSVDALFDYVDEFAKEAEDESRVLLTAPFIPHLAYFRDQFVDAERSSTNAAFEKLNIQQSEHRGLVSHALIKLDDETPELVKALLIIVHRLRDSLFRGLKWHESDKKRRDDLYHASKVLMKAFDVIGARSVAVRQEQR